MNYFDSFHYLPSPSCSYQHYRPSSGGSVDLMQGQFRVCQNLNLSRALGDLRYKENKHVRTGRRLSRDEHIICGVPDVSIVELNE